MPEAERMGNREVDFRSVVTARRAALVRTATLLAAGDTHLAEDLVQTALTRLYVAWPRVDRDRGPEHYARRILVNALVDEQRRGQRALRRRRSLGTISGGLALAAAVTVGVAVVPNLGGDDPGVQVVAPAGDGTADANPGVDLVPWDAGATPKPISPSVVPQGWTITGSEFALVISAPGTTTTPDDFQGKLVAMLAGDSTAAADARPVSVGSAKGTISREGDTTILLADGRRMDAQSPSTLHWDTATLVRFAEGLAVGADAVASRG